MKRVMSIAFFLLFICFLSCYKYYSGDNARPPSVSSITITVPFPKMAPADNTSDITVTATVRDKSGKPMKGQPINLSSSGTGFLLSPAGQQNSNSSGQAIWRIYSSAEGAMTITASISGTSLNDTENVYFYSSGGLSQPDGTLIPSDMGCNGGKPAGLAVVLASQCVDAGMSNIGVPCIAPGNCDDGINSTCETTLWHEFNDDICIPSRISGLNPRDSAFINPNTFKPAGPVVFKIASRGTAMFKNAFGWYNATGTKPDSTDLHVVLDCNVLEGDSVIVDILNNPAYNGGNIGFFIVTPESHSSPNTCDGGDCNATLERFNSGTGYVYYSERNYNPDMYGTSYWIHMLIYASLVWENKFYFAWEDIYNTTGNDFTDFVVSATGLGF